MKVKGFNDYELREDYAVIFATRKSKRYEILVDIDDFYMLLNAGYRWCVSYDSNIDGFYAHTNVYSKNSNGKRAHSNFKIHNYILETSNIVDHIDHNTLNNRRGNLRIVTNAQNLKNRKGKNKNNKSGYRNVSRVSGKWVVQLVVNGKNTRLGAFDDVHEAGAFAEDMRKKHYGEFAGRG